MMTSNFSEEAARRDEDLINALCHSIHHNSLRDLREWIQGELVTLINAAQLIELEVGSPLADTIKEKIDRLQFINLTSLPKATEVYSNTINNVSEGLCEDVHDAYIAMQRECSVLVNFMEELLSIRKMLEPMLPKED